MADKNREDVVNWHQLEVVEVLEELATNAESGLSVQQVSRRLKEYGYNEFNSQKLKGVWRILWEQLTESLVLILLAGALISWFLGDYKDALGILAIVVLIAILGLTQEYRAEQAIAELKKLAVPKVKVRRASVVQELSARYLVPGDIIDLEAEDLVPADCRLIDCLGLRTQESVLTGIPEPMDKDTAPLPRASHLSERVNMVYMGTTVTYGWGRAVVVATGANTEFGRIYAMVKSVPDESTPLQKKLKQLGKELTLASLALVALILVLGLMRGEQLQLMFLTGITLVVAAIPEGLPAVVTIALALGAQKMLRRRALIRKLPAVEALGSVTVICSGKTGTLTENRLTVTVLDVAGHRLDLPARLRSYCPLPGMMREQPLLLSKPPALSLLLAGGVLCNDARLEPEPEEPRCFHGVGDPVEVALVTAAAREGLWKSELEKCLPRVGEVPFNARRERMTTVHRLPPSRFLPVALQTVWHWCQTVGDVDYIAFTKGKVDSLLSVCSQVWVDGSAKALSGKWLERVISAQGQITRKGLRVLGIAFRPLPSHCGTSWEESEREMIFVGLVGMTDPARPEARESILTCKMAGIRPIMITGDHPLTAWHLARELDITVDNQLFTTRELQQLSAEKLSRVLQEVSVYARVTPEHKFNIVQALQKQGHIVAMTGDGINDAPALKAADIGVAMGIAGTEAAKEVADMVLLDDNFATLVAAVKEGRAIYDNIRKFIKYLLSSNVGELLVMLLAPFLGMPLPLLPLQILWINLTTDGLPALALGVEPPERNIMNRPPHHPHESIFGRGMGTFILSIGLLMGVVSLGVGYWYWRDNHEHGLWQTMLFTVLTLSQMGNALAVRSERESLFQIGIFSNKSLLAAVTLTLILQLAVIYLPPLQRLFNTVSLSPINLVFALLLSTVVFWVIELEKWLVRQGKIGTKLSGYNDRKWFHGSVGVKGTDQH